MNHLVMTSLLMVATHIACFAAMTERKYSVKKTLLLYGLYALFFIVWALLAFMLLGKTSPHVISFSFVGTIVPAVALFLYTSADSFSKKLFLILTYANIFCIILCLSVLLCDSLLPGLSRVGQIYARSIVRIALNVPAILLYLRYARPYMRTVPGTKDGHGIPSRLYRRCFYLCFPCWSHSSCAIRATPCIPCCSARPR